MTAVAVVVVSYNTADLLGQCLASVRDEAERTPSLRVEVVVVDNASHDESASVAEASGAQVIRLSSNVGFAEACNIGAATTASDLILFLNPDAVMLPGCLAALVACYDANPSAGIVGGRSVRPDGSADVGSAMGPATMWGVICFATGLSTLRAGSAWFDPDSMGGLPDDDEAVVGSVAGSLLLISRSLWITLGGFSQRYFMYGEDADLAARARGLGYAPRVTPRASIRHVSGASSSSTDKWLMLMRGKVTLLQRTWPPGRAAVGVRLLVLGAGVRSAGSRWLVAAAPWRETWRARAQWRDGWTPENDPRSGILRR